jgi:uncharacterized membrane protein
MALTLTFTVASMLVGLAQVIDAFVLFKNRGVVTRGATYFSIFEYLWAVLCLFILTSDHIVSSRWLAIAFLAYFPAVFAIAFLASPRIFTNQTGMVRIPMMSVYFSGLFGACYAIACLASLIGA